MSERVRSSRFSVYVPNPKVRLNMGLPIYKPEDGAGTFGYTGMSLQSDRHLFIDVNKVALYQSGSHSMWQVGGKWLQYSNANMVMACTASNTLAASAKVVIAAGAGHGQITALDHAQPHVTPRMVDYNNLDLHYRVEEVHNGLKALMYGPNWQTSQKKSQTLQQTQFRDGYDGGLLEDFRQQFEDLGHGEQQARAMLQPLEWEGNYVEMKNGFPPGGDTSVFPAIKPFDPYPVAGFRNPGAAKTFGYFLQTVNFFHRFCDVLGKVGPAITDNFIGSRIQNLMAIWGNAQEGLNSAMNVGDFVRWDRSSGETGFSMADEAGNVAARPQAASFGSGGASLTSVPELYDLTGLSGDDAKIDVYDTKNGTKHTLTLTIDDTSAGSARLTPATDHAEVAVTVTTANSPASIQLGSETILYRDQGGGNFGWNEAQSFTRTGNHFKHNDGARFGVGTLSNCSVASVVSGTLKIEVDGTEKSIDLSTFANAADRASELASQIGSTAAASGNVVTLTSAIKGSGSTLKVPTDEGATELAKTWLGISSRIEKHGTDKGTAAWLAGQLSSLGLKYSASAGSPEDLGSDVCTVTHNQSGSSAYLKITGGATSRLFGEDPAISEGKDEDFLKTFGDLRVLQFEIAKWPEDVRNLFRPVVEAFKDVMAVYDRIAGIIDEVLSLVGLKPGPPAVIGMFAGDGITLGTGGKLFAAGDGITLISSSAGDPDDRKFAMGPVEKWLLKAADWDPLQEYWKNRDAGHPFQVEKKLGHGSGGIRIVSGEDLFLASKQEMRLASLTDLRLDAPHMHFTSAADATLAVRDGGFTVHAKEITLGIEAKDAAVKQEATEWLRLVTKEKVEIKSAKAAVVMDNDMIHLGGRGSQAFAGKLDKPRLKVSTKSGKESVAVGTGDMSGDVAYGLVVEADGNPFVMGKSELTLAAKTTGISLKSSGVEVTGQFKVGPEFVVKSSGKLSPQTVVASVLAQHPRALKLPAEYAAIMVQAKAQLVAITGVITNLELAEKSRRGAILPPARLAADKLIHMLQEQFMEMKAMLADLDGDRRRLIAEAQLYDLDDGALGRTEPDDTDVFYEKA
ncbi:MAG: hypothetical protein KC766_36105 [Myxococcales bacterium]|nr:hypothetical protein [Myxococcales bacterium]